MLNKNRVPALLLALLLTLAAAGCGAKTPQNEPATPAPAPAATDAAPAAATDDIILAATGVGSDETVMVVGGNSAPAELLAYQVGYSCAYLDYLFQMYGMEPFDLSGTMPDGQDAAEYVRGESIEMLRQLLVLENLAAENGVTLSADEEAELAQNRQDEIAELGGEDAYRAELRTMGLTEAGYDRVMRASYLYDALEEAFADPNSALYVPDDELAAYAEEQGYITADHILIPTIDLATQEPLSDAEIAENRALAEDLLWRLRDSRDPIALFKTLADEYSQDSGRLSNPDGYTFPEGQMVDEFDTAARALAEGEYSDLVESVYGYHIILRKPLDAAAAADAVRAEAFDSFFLDAVERSDMELTPAAERFSVADVYKALDAAQAELTGAAENPFAP